MTSMFSDPKQVALLRQNLGSDFDQFDDEELEIALNAMWGSFENWMENLMERFPYDPNIAVGV